MKGFSAIAFGVALLLAAGLLGSSDAEARSCFRIYAKADGSGSEYRHFVYVENNCDYWIRCSVWTDVNPRPPKMLSVAPSATESAETNSRSEYDNPEGFGVCREK
jgi:hypothetical protein